MLCGRDDLIKPDRMVLRWLARHAGQQVTAADARDMLAWAAKDLTDRLGRTVTPWMADHAIWRAETDRPTIVVHVEGLPPIKNEALSLFGAAHPQRERVQRLLTAVAEAVGKTRWVVVTGDVALDVVVRSPTPRSAGDATNFLGGIADVLQVRKTKQGVDLYHLGELAACALFADERQGDTLASGADVIHAQLRSRVGCVAAWRTGSEYSGRCSCSRRRRGGRPSRPPWSTRTTRRSRTAAATAVARSPTAPAPDPTADSVS
jgi:hypothetical protein